MLNDIGRCEFHFRLHQIGIFQKDQPPQSLFVFLVISNVDRFCTSTSSTVIGPLTGDWNVAMIVLRHEIKWGALSTCCQSLHQWKETEFSPLDPTLTVEPLEIAHLVLLAYSTQGHMFSFEIVASNLWFRPNDTMINLLKFAVSANCNWPSEVPNIHSCSLPWGTINAAHFPWVALYFRSTTKFISLLKRTLNL